MNKTQIIDNALLALGHPGIIFAGRQDVREQLLNEQFDFCLNEVAESGIYNLGYKTEKLTKVQLDGDFDINYRFAYLKPQQCKIIKWVGGLDEVKDFAFEKFNHKCDLQTVIHKGASVILSNADEAYICYFQKVEDTFDFSTNLSNALSYLIASKIAVLICGEEKGMTKSAAMLQLYNYYIGQAHANALNAQSSMQNNKRTPNFIKARGYDF